MPFLTLDEYLQIIERAWDVHDGYKVASLLSIRSEHAGFANYHVEYPEGIVERFLLSPLNDFVCCHLKCLHYLANQNYLFAYQQQSSLTQCVVKFLQSQKEDNWSLQIMHSVTLDLRLIAQKADKQNEEINGKPGEILEKAAESLMSCFRACATDNRSTEETRDTKRMGMMTLVNQLFKVYFRINKLHLCKPLIRAIESSPLKDMFSLSQQITYRYFVGRKAMFDSDYKLANEYLTYAFENCHKCSAKNKRLILIYLVPVKMLLGFIPKKYILEKYNLMEFSELVHAVSQGNLQLFDQLLKKHGPFYCKYGIYLIVDKLKMIAYRNLFRKVHLVLNTHHISIEILHSVLVYLEQVDIDITETQGLVASLIYDGKIKGYISEHRRVVVFSKQNPFPSLSGS